MDTYCGIEDVARWCGVTRQAVLGWRRRYGEWPVEPVLTVRIGSGAPVRYGWTADQEADWRRWITVTDPIRNQSGHPRSPRQ